MSFFASESARPTGLASNQKSDALKKPSGITITSWLPRNNEPL